MRNPHSSSGPRLGFTLAEIAAHGEELREASGQAEALSKLFAEKIAVVDAKMASLAALRQELAERAGTRCPLKPDRETIQRRSTVAEPPL